jgi:hypothetical protein
MVRGERIQAYGAERAGGGLTASVVVIDSGSTVGQPPVWSYPQNQTSHTRTVSGRDPGPRQTTYGDSGSTRTHHH